MNRHVFERLYDTVAFGIALGLSGALVVPVLLMGISMTISGGVTLLFGQSAMELKPAYVAFALLSIGGALGFTGYVRARWGEKDPTAHNVTATIVFLAAGVPAALSVVGVIVALMLSVWLETGESPLWLLPSGAFAAANLVWALAGIARMQRLLRRYAEHTGHAFDGVPVLLLLVALALATAAAFVATTL